jgi:hypothetical protein
VTAPGAQIIAIDAPTLADAIPLQLDCWDPGEDVGLRPALADGWRTFVAELTTAIHARKEGGAGQRSRTEIPPLPAPRH